MGTINGSVTLVATALMGAVLFFATTHDAFAHANFEFKAGGNVNNTIRVVLGQTHEPSFTDEEHNLEMTVTHKLSSIPVANLGKAQTIAGTNQMFVDTYFYPDSVLVGADKHVPALSGCTAASPNPANCAPGAGYVDNEIHASLSAISAAFPDSGSPGQYRQGVRQYYTEQGRTLYHVYGQMNIFNDTGVGTIPINLWTDGSVTASGISRVSVCEGLDGNKAACMSGTATYNKTYALAGSFSMENMTSIYWPGASAGVTENTHPSNLRKAVGSIRDNTFDIWNVLEEITDALRTVTGFGPVQDHVPRNSTNSGAPTSYTYP